MQKIDVKQEILKQRYDRLINNLFYFLFFVAPLTRAGVNIVAPILTIVWISKKIKFRGGQEEAFKYPDFLKGIGLLGVAILLSFFNAIDYARAIENTLDEYVLLSIIFIISLDVIKTEKQITDLLKIGVLSGLLVGLYGVYEHYVLGHERIESTFSLATQTGVYLIGVVLLTFAFMFLRKTNKRSTLINAFLFFTFILFCTFLTGSRAAWLGFGAGAAFLLIHAFKGDKQDSLKKIGVVLVILLLTAAFVDLDWIITRLASITDFSNSSNRQRIMMYLGGLAMWKDHPLIGIGMGQFPLVYAEYRMEGAKIFTHLHCFYLHLLVETGLIGFAAFLFLVYKVLKRGIGRSAQLRADQIWFYYGVLGVLVGLGVCNIFDWTFPNQQIGTFTLVIVAMWLNLLNVIKRDNSLEG